MIDGIMEKWIAVAFIVAVICVIRMLVRGKIRPCVIYGLWALVAVRLLWPAALALPESRYSIQNWQVSQKISQEYEKVQEGMDPGFLISNMGQEPEQFFTGSEQHPNGGDVSVGPQNAGLQNVGQNPDVPGPEGPDTDHNTTTESGNIQNFNSGGASQPGTTIRQPVSDLQQQSQPAEPAVILPVWGWIWLAGSTMMAAGVVFGQWQFYRRLKKERTLWITADQICDQVTTSLPVYIWEGASSPFLYGVIRPAIYVPSAFTEEEQMLDYILLHEWCHYRHGDHVWAMIRVICLILYWHHPMVWVAAALSRSDCELACDDSVRICLGEKQRLAYAGTLLTILEAEVRRERFGYMTTSMSGGGKEAARRMKMLWEKRPGKVLTVLVACITVLGMGCAAFTSDRGTAGDDESLRTEADSQGESLADGQGMLTEGPGSSAEDPIPVEPGMQLLSRVYYSCEIDKRDGAEVFCYLGLQSGHPRFEINGLFMTNARTKLGDPIYKVADGVKREVYYLMDLRADDGRKELAVVTEGENGVVQTNLYKYEHSWISRIGGLDGVDRNLVDEIDADAAWYERLTFDPTGVIQGWKRSELTDLYYMDCQWQLSEAGDKLIEVAPTEGWYRYGDEGAIHESVPYLQGNLMLYTQPDPTAELILLATEAEFGSPQEAEQTIGLIQTDNAHWIQVEAWNGTTGWVYMEAPGILRIDGKLYAWDNFVEGPIVTRDALISTVHQERTRDEEEAWLESILKKEPIPIEIGEDGIQLLADVLYQADLDGNGMIDRFCYLGSDSETYGPRFVINGKKYYVGEGYEPVITSPTGIYVKYAGFHGEQQETYYLCDIRIGDGQVEFGIPNWMEGKRKTSFLAYDGNHMEYIGTVDNIPFATADQWAFGVRSRELEQENLANGTWGFDGKGHIGLSIPLNLLQTWCGNVVWELDENTNWLRMLPQKDGLYEVSDPWYYENDSLSEDGFAYYPHLAKDLVVYAEPDLQARTLVFRVEDHGPDNKIYFTHTDNEHWIRIVDDAGLSGWFYMKDFARIRTEEGLVPAEDIFGYLYLVG